LHKLGLKLGLLDYRLGLASFKDIENKCKKLQFIHKLMASDTSKTAKITKR